MFDFSCVKVFQVNSEALCDLWFINKVLWYFELLNLCNLCTQDMDICWASNVSWNCPFCTTFLSGLCFLTKSLKIRKTSTKTPVVQDTLVKSETISILLFPAGNVEAVQNLRHFRSSWQKIKFEIPTPQEAVKWRQLICREDNHDAQLLSVPWWSKAIKHLGNWLDSFVSVFASTQS